MPQTRHRARMERAAQLALTNVLEAMKDPTGLTGPLSPMSILTPSSSVSEPAWDGGSSDTEMGEVNHPSKAWGKRKAQAEGTDTVEESDDVVGALPRIDRRTFGQPKPLARLRARELITPTTSFTGPPQVPPAPRAPAAWKRSRSRRSSPDKTSDASSGRSSQHSQPSPGIPSAAAHQPPRKRARYSAPVMLHDPTPPRERNRRMSYTRDAEIVRAVERGERVELTRTGTMLFPIGLARGGTREAGPGPGLGLGIGLRSPFQSTAETAVGLTLRDTAPSTRRGADEPGVRIAEPA